MDKTTSPDDRNRKPAPATQDQTYPEGMEKERAQPDEKMPSDSDDKQDHGQDHGRITTARQPLYIDNDPPGAASGDPTQ